jgi:hypothetical protein
LAAVATAAASPAASTSRREYRELGTSLCNESGGNIRKLKGARRNCRRNPVVDSLDARLASRDFARPRGEIMHFSYWHCNQ